MAMGLIQDPTRPYNPRIYRHFKSSIQGPKLPRLRTSPESMCRHTDYTEFF